MQTTRKNFLKALAAAGTAITVPQALCGKDGIDKYLTHGTNPPNHHPIVNGWDNRPHYPVMENIFGEMEWEKKGTYEIVADITKGVAEVQKLSLGNFIPTKHLFFIGLPPSRAEFLQKEFCFGKTVEWYIRNCWPNVHIWKHRMVACIRSEKTLIIRAGSIRFTSLEYH